MRKTRAMALFMTEVALKTGRPLVFDLDGTLIDSRGDIASACNHALRSIGRPELSTAQISRFVGNGAAYLLENTSGIERTAPAFAALLTTFKEFYIAHPTDFSAMLPGAEEALRLPGRPIALCTNKPRPITERVIEGLQLSAYFDVVVAAGDCRQIKPHPEPLQLVARQLGVQPSELVMIGDGPQDVLSGKAVGAHTIGLRGGFLPEEMLLQADPDGLLDSLLALPAYLERMRL